MGNGASSYDTFYGGTRRAQARPPAARTAFRREVADGRNQEKARRVINTMKRLEKTEPVKRRLERMRNIYSKHRDAMYTMIDQLTDGRKRFPENRPSELLIKYDKQRIQEYLIFHTKGLFNIWLRQNLGALKLSRMTDDEFGSFITSYKVRLAHEREMWLRLGLIRSAQRGDPKKYESVRSLEYYEDGSPVERYESLFDDPPPGWEMLHQFLGLGVYNPASNAAPPSEMALLHNRHPRTIKEHLEPMFKTEFRRMCRDMPKQLFERGIRVTDKFMRYVFEAAHDLMRLGIFSRERAISVGGQILDSPITHIHREPIYLIKEGIYQDYLYWPVLINMFLENKSFPKSFPIGADPDSEVGADVGRTFSPEDRFLVGEVLEQENKQWRADVLDLTFIRELIGIVQTLE